MCKYFVKIRGRRYEIEVYQRSKTVWVAPGEYMLMAAANTMPRCVAPGLQF